MAPKAGPSHTEVSKTPEEDLRETRILISDLKFHRIPVITEIWHIVLGISALLDFLSIVLPRVLLPEEDEFIEEKENPFLFRKDKGEIIPDKEEPFWYFDELQWVEGKATEISIVFSLLWFVHAFVSARRNRLKSLRERDRQLLMMEVKKSGSRHLVTEKQDLSRLDDWISGGWGPFYGTVFLQLVLLPVGFFFWCIHISRGNFDADISEDERIEIKYNSTDEMPAFHETLSTHTTQSVAFAIVHYCSIVVSHVAGAQIRAFQRSVKRFEIRMGRRLAFMAVRNPKKFARRVRKALTCLRWVKYLAPLIGAGNKLLGNVTDLTKKYNQKREAARAARIRRAIWVHLTDDQLMEAAAVVIQKTWRKHMTSRKIAALKLLRGEKEALAALKMQKVFKGMLKRARVRLKKKENELRKLQEEERNLLMAKKRLNVEERMRMYQLQEEVGAEEKKTVQQKLLLRPNTTFAVTWKVLFVICVILEIGHLALKPALKRWNKKIPGRPDSTGKVLEYKLVPVPIEEWERCNPGTPSDEEDKRRPPLINGVRKWRQKRRVSKWEKQSHPWYCDNAIVIVAQSLYISSLRFILEETILLIGIVCFLDVPVTFWTGDFDEAGSLVPKPWFTRWILPGLTLQLLVNPAMADVSRIVRKLIHGAMHVGPVRVIRWSMALFIPLTELFFTWIEYAIWLPLTISQNYRQMK